MEIKLKEEPKNPIIIEGFPGFGFVSTITTEFLIKQLNAKKIGTIFSDKLTPMAAIHDSKIIDPIELYYDKMSNIVIVRALTNIAGAEWEVGDIVIELSKKLKAKEVIGIEGIATDGVGGIDSYYFTNMKTNNFDKIKVPALKNGIIMGVTGVLLLRAKDLPFSSIFVEANPQIPDSRAAGEVIKVLDNYLGLKIDYKPLMKTAEKVESKIKKLMSQTKFTSQMKQDKEASYLG